MEDTVMNMVQIGMIGVLGALLAIQFKGGKTEYGIYLSVAVSIVLFLCIVVRWESFVRTMRSAVISVWIPDICPRC